METNTHLDNKIWFLNGFYFDEILTAAFDAGIDVSCYNDYLDFVGAYCGH